MIKAITKTGLCEKRNFRLVTFGDKGGGGGVKNSPKTGDIIHG